MTRTSNVPRATFEYFSGKSISSDIPATTPASKWSSDASASSPRSTHAQCSDFEVSQDTSKDSGHVESRASFGIPVLSSKSMHLAPNERGFAPAYSGGYGYQCVSTAIPNSFGSTMTIPGFPPANPLREQDSSGQVAPIGKKPRLTATLWEDEGCLCFQVEANNTTVGRRDDSHMINGTELLNVAGVDRLARDTILQSENTCHVVIITPKHMKGVWIPLDRALDLANRFGITDVLYPLFVENIGALLYHPVNQSRAEARPVLRGQLHSPYDHRF